MNKTQIIQDLTDLLEKHNLTIGISLEHVYPTLLILSGEEEVLEAMRPINKETI